MVLAVKKWAKDNRINSAHQKTFSSYSLALMVIHYLQICSPPVLPCLQTMLPGVFSLDDDYRSYKLNDILVSYQSANKQSLGQLFLGFLQYFSYDFDYDNSAISVRLGRAVSKDVCRGCRSEKNTDGQWMYICIEEPFDRTNTACAINDSCIFSRILSILRKSYMLLRNGLPFDSLAIVIHG